MDGYWPLVLINVRPTWDQLLFWSTRRTYNHMMMERILKPFRGLRWKLTLSYTLVTVAALVVVEVIVVLGLWSILANPTDYPKTVISVIKSYVVPQVASYLDPTEPDLIGLQNWLRSTSTEDGLRLHSPSYPGIEITLGNSDQDTFLVVLNEDMSYIAGIPELELTELDVLISEASTVIEAALSGDEDPGRVSMTTLDQGLFTALPVSNNSGLLLGVVVLKTSLPSGLPLPELVYSILRSLLIFVLAAGAVGTIFGYFTARGLTKRLQHVSQAADHWSSGDFTVFIQDHSRDEISRLSQQLNRMAEQLQNLLQTQQELAALEERNRLARDLHDSVKQQVFATAMQVGTAKALLDLDPAGVREHLNEAERLARQAQTELSALIRELHPAPLEDKGLNQALREYADAWSRQNNIATEVTISGICKMSSNVAQTLFRIAQEGLANIARHSEATIVKINLDRLEDGFSLTISDNGCGFDIDTVAGKGLGLQSMRERMQALDGSLDVVSTPGAGTSLTARCQCANEEVP